MKLDPASVVGWATALFRREVQASMGHAYAPALRSERRNEPICVVLPFSTRNENVGNGYPIRANFGLLPEPERSPASFVTSAVVNLTILAIILYVGMTAKRVMERTITSRRS